MRKILALDAATEVCSVSLAIDDVIYEESCDTPRSHSKVLLPMIDGLLKQAEINLRDLDIIAMTNGPGSFTGIRICIGVAQGLAYGANIPMSTWSTLEVMAAQAIFKDGVRDRPIITALDARMNEVYWAAYQFNDQKIEMLSEPRVSSPDVLESWLQIQRFERILGVGHGWSMLQRGDDSDNEIKEHYLPQASSIIRAFNNRTETGVEIAIVNPDCPVEPLYLRNEISWEKRKRVRSS